MTEPVLIVGWDGAPFTDVHDWIADGRLPNLERIAGDGYFGPLNSVPYVMSPCAWSTFLTGTNAGKHGVFDFYATDFRDGTYFREPIDARNREQPELWELLNAQDRSAGFLNVPVTYPAADLDEFMVSGVLSPDVHDPEFASPEGFLDDYEDLDDYLIDLDVGKDDDRDEFLDTVHRMVERRADLALHCVEQCDDIDVFMVVFTAPDRLSHYFWHFHDEAHPYRETESEATLSEYQDVLLELFELLDEKLGELYSAFEETVVEPGSVAVVSDHGMDSLDTMFFVNQWLADRGYLTFAEGEEEYGPEELPDQKEYVFGRVDWSETQAYSIGKAGDIYVNLEGREPEGSVAPEDYESVRSAIADDLRKLSDPETGEEVLADVTPREEVFDGPYTETAPDLLVTLMGGYYSLGYLFEGETFLRNARPDAPFVTGIEDGPGIVCQSGPLFSQRAIDSVDFGLIDYVPTLLHGLGLNCSPEMDGRVVTELVESSGDVSLDPDLAKGTERTPSEDVSESVEQRLKDLGYR